MEPQWINLLFIAAMMAVFWFMIIQPQRKEQAAVDRLRANLAKDDRVVLAGGLHVKIVSVAEKTVVAEIAPGVKVTVERAGVLRKAAEPAQSA